MQQQTDGEECQRGENNTEGKGRRLGRERKGRTCQYGEEEEGLHTVPAPILSSLRLQTPFSIPADGRDGRRGEGEG